jgi:hypothetical protein
MPEPIACPDPTCTAPATVVDRWTWASSDGPVEHVKTTCTRGHWFTPPLEAVVALPAAAPLAAAAAR